MKLSLETAGVVDLPRITVITVVFNGRDCIESTISSVLGQTYPNLEYIIIDGGSMDGTIDIIQKYDDKIDFWQSEEDAGIYDAMNKGLGRATGRWVNFMNAGDTFYSYNTVADIFSAGAQTATIIYGGVEIVYPDMSRIQEPGDPGSLWKGMQFCHQSAFVDVAYHQAHLFDIDKKIVADLAFFYEAFRRRARFHNCGKVISRVITGGVSETNRVKAILSSCEVICGQRFRFFIRLYYVGCVINSILRSWIKFFLPRSVIKRLILLK